MSQAKLSVLLCSGLLACSGRYVSHKNDGAGPDTVGGAGAASAGGQVGSQPPIAAGGVSVGGATSTAGSGPTAGEPPQVVTETACGVPQGRPADIEPPISNYMMWWTRLSKLIWAEQPHAPPPDLPFVISHEQAGKLADDAIDQAIAETKGIPGVAPFLRHWLQLGAPDTKFLVDWNSALTKDSPLDSLLNQRFDTDRVGVFTEPAFLTAQPAISQRGAVMLSALFAQQVPREPAGFPRFIPPAGLTRREGLAQAVADPVCMACHAVLDPLGFALENWDDQGNYVTVDAGKPVDASGTVGLPSSGGELEFVNMVDLGKQLARTCDANLGLADRFLTFALEQSGAENTALEDHELDRARMRQAFMRGGRTYRSLIKAFAQGPAIRAE